ncbi:MAG: hypothetical protein V1684_02970 [bacterium]
MADNQIKSASWRIGQLEINPGKTKDWLVKVFVTRTSPAKEKALGKMFGLLEAKFTKQVDEMFLENLVKNLKTNYYQFDNEAEEVAIETIFEQAIKRTNSEISDLVKEKAGFDLKNFRAIVAVIKDQQLHFAPVGLTNVLLVRQLALLDESARQADRQNYKIINVLATTQETADRPTPTKIFSNIISGEIKEADALVLANNNFLDYLSLDKIKKIITTLPAGTAAEQFKNLLLGVNQDHAFGALTVKFVPLIAKPMTDRDLSSAISPQKSMAELIDTEANTEKLLTPSLGFNLLDYFKKITNYLTARKLSQNLYNHGSYGQSAGFFKTILRQLGKGLILSGYLLRGLFSLIVKPASAGRRTSADGINETAPLSQRSDNLANKFFQLPKINKIILIVALIFIIAFTQSIIILSKRQTNKVEQQQYEQMLGKIREKQDTAEARLIFEDEDGARQLLVEARSLLITLPQNARQRRKDFSSLTEKNEQLLAKTKKIINVDRSTIIADLSNARPNFLAQQLIISGNQLITNNLSENAIYSISLDDQPIKKLAGAEIALRHGNNLDEQSLLFEQENGFTKFNLTDNTFSPITVEFNSANQPAIKDFMIYNKRLYVLDKANRQIYKHEATEAGFGPGAPWLKNSPDLSQAVSLTADGYLYVLSNNEIKRFLRGNEQPLTIANLEPTLNQPTKLWTDIESNYLYLLDPANKRLVVLTKDGKLQGQYYSDQFNNLKDFAVKEVENKIYLLNGTQVVEIPLQPAEKS